MKLRSKSGKISFYVEDLDTKIMKEINLSDYLTQRQRRKIKSKPDMILQFAHYLAEEAVQNGQKNVSVFARSQCGLNGRYKTDLINTKAEKYYYEKEIFHHLFKDFFHFNMRIVFIILPIQNY